MSMHGFDPKQHTKDLRTKLKNKPPSVLRLTAGGCTYRTDLNSTEKPLKMELTLKPQSTVGWSEFVA